MRGKLNIVNFWSVGLIAAVAMFAVGALCHVDDNFLFIIRLIAAVIIGGSPTILFAMRFPQIMRSLKSSYNKHPFSSLFMALSTYLVGLVTIPVSLGLFLLTYGSFCQMFGY